MVRAEDLGATRIMGPETIMDRVDVGHFSDPEGHLIGLITFKANAQNGSAAAAS
jgi:hypothetical protein